jgi:voltage-gated potassium channel Kch
MLRTTQDQSRPEPPAPSPAARRWLPYQRGGWRSFVVLYWQWVLMLTLAATAILLGLIGLEKYFAAAGQPRKPLDIGYFLMCLFVVESGDMSGPVPWQLAVARLLAPVVPAWAVIRAAAVLFREQLQAVRLLFARHHTVICGVGQQGLELTRDFRAHGDRVVVIEENGEDERLQTCRDWGALVIVGDATERSTLCRARVQDAERVVALCGLDGTNVEVAVRVYELLRAGDRRSRSPVQCHIRVFDLELCRLLRQHEIFTRTDDPFEVKIFNAYENSARLLWTQHPLDRVPLARNDPRTVHLLVIGFGQMGESVAVQAARIAHFAHGQRLRITVVDEQAAEKRKRFCARYPQLGNLCDATFLPGRAEDVDTQAEVCRLATERNTVSTLAVCLDGDARALTVALGLLANLGDHNVPVMVRMADETGLATLLDQRETRAGLLTERLYAFGALSQSCTRELLLHEQLDLLARAIHQRQVGQYRAEGRTAADPALAPWEQLQENLRESNRHQADHIPVKLRAIDCGISVSQDGGPGVDAFTPEEVGLLARMEHARWNAERWLDGWTLGPARDHQRKISPYLVDWEQLPEEIKEYDRIAVRNIPSLLGLLNARIQRQPPLDSAAGQEP